MRGTIERINRAAGNGTIYGENDREFRFDGDALLGLTFDDLKLGSRVDFEPGVLDDRATAVGIFDAYEAPKPATPLEASQIEGVPADQVPPPSVNQGDDVAQASWESFPASDAPAFTRGAA